jgi:hypothetical protein
MSSVADHKRRFSPHSEGRVSTNTQQRRSFARLLWSAVVMNWTDLISDGQPGVVHIDCRFGDEDAVVHLTIWVATERGEWRLVGEYSMSKRTKMSFTGMSFESGYRSERLAGTLDTIFQHQHSFAPLPNRGRDGLIEVEQPTSREKRRAENLIASMFRLLQDE